MLLKRKTDDNENWELKGAGCCKTGLISSVDGGGQKYHSDRPSNYWGISFSATFVTLGNAIIVLVNISTNKWHVRGYRKKTCKGTGLRNWYEENCVSKTTHNHPN